MVLPQTRVTLALPSTRQLAAFKRWLPLVKSGPQTYFCWPIHVFESFKKLNIKDQKLISKKIPGFSGKSDQATMKSPFPYDNWLELSSSCSRGCVPSSLLVSAPHYCSTLCLLCLTHVTCLTHIDVWLCDPWTWGSLEFLTTDAV